MRYFFISYRAESTTTTIGGSMWFASEKFPNRNRVVKEIKQGEESMQCAVLSIQELTEEDYAEWVRE